MKDIRFAAMASGRGSNVEALIKMFLTFDKAHHADLSLIISNKPDALVLDMADSYGFDNVCIPNAGMKRVGHEKLVLEKLEEYKIDHLLLAGYMRVLSPYFISNFKGKIINIHPALLPEFKGAHAIKDQFEAEVKIAGATVHFVDEGVDTGQPILMGSVDLLGNETEDEIASRVLHEVEHVIYPRAVQLFIERLRRGYYD